MIKDFVTDITNRIAIKLYNNFSSLSFIFEILLYPLIISQHAASGSFIFIIPYEHEIAKSFIVWVKTVSPKSIIDLTDGFSKSFETIILLSLISLWIIDFGKSL